MNVLLVRFSAVGDCVMAAWAATAVRTKYRDASIDWAVETRCADVVDTARLVSRRIDFPRHVWKKARWSPRTWRDQMTRYARLRERRYDLGADLQGHSKTALCLYLAKPARRASAYATDGLARKLTPPIGEKPPEVHQVEWMMRTINALEPFETPVRPLMPPVDRTRWSALGSPLASIAVGAGHPNKTVAPEVWFGTGEMLRDSGWSVVYFGGPEVRFEAPEGTTNLIGKTTLAEWTEATASSDLVLSGDTGMGHIAAAYGVPVVSLFGPNDPRTFRPYTDRAIVLKKGDTVEGHSADEAYSAAKTLMGERWPSAF